MEEKTEEEDKMRKGTREEMEGLLEEEASFFKDAYMATEEKEWMTLSYHEVKEIDFMGEKMEGDWSSSHPIIEWEETEEGFLLKDKDMEYFEKNLRRAMEEEVLEEPFMEKEMNRIYITSSEDLEEACPGFMEGVNFEYDEASHEGMSPEEMKVEKVIMLESHQARIDVKTCEVMKCREGLLVKGKKERRIVHTAELALLSDGSDYFLVRLWGNARYKNIEG